MFNAPHSPYIVPFEQAFEVSKAATSPPETVADKSNLKKKLNQLTNELDDLQRILYSQDHHAVLLIFQAMDAAGKDSTIRAIMTGVNPAGCQVHSFKKPSTEEISHDFLWRTTNRLPSRGMIGIFNRSYYEEVLTVRVHPELLIGERLPDKIKKNIWQERLESIVDHEKHLARNGYVILKFWLNISKEEQRNRFLARIDNPNKHWKFSTDDIKARSYWNDYMKAYQKALNATSKSWAPWYAIPADNKPYMQTCIAEIIVKSLKKLKLAYPESNDTQHKHLANMRNLLETDPF